MAVELRGRLSVPENGYEWKGRGRARRLHPIGQKSRQYDPLDVPELYVKADQLEPREGAVLDFCNAYGLMVNPMGLDAWTTAVGDIHVAMSRLWVHRPGAGHSPFTLLSSFSCQLAVRDDHIEVQFDHLFPFLLLGIGKDHLEGGQLRRCKECRAIFLTGPGRGRADKAVCSERCRLRAFRRKKGTTNAKKTKRSR